ncbi:MAG TPA: hemerythrin domain-containing protein [Ktedonobacteraceae bacterium]|nr:hemerythrin domain-containing protein [Ktedonobacteraceae bacterium]
MTTLPKIVRDVHKELVAHIEVLRTLANRVGSRSIESLRGDVGQVYSFLVHQLIPHAQAEEQVLYPTVGRVLRAVEAGITWKSFGFDMHHVS